MATFRNRDGKWQARIQQQGQTPVSKSTTTRQDAERWARQIEAQIDQGRFVSLQLDERTTFGELISRHIAEVTPLMKGAKEDLIRLTALKRNPLCKLSMVALTPTRVAKFRDQRMKQVSAGTKISGQFRPIKTNRRTVPRARSQRQEGLSLPWWKSTAPRTSEGRQRCPEARTTQGHETTSIRMERALASARLAVLEEV